jgi:hypothetical protein
MEVNASERAEWPLLWPVGNGGRRDVTQYKVLRVFSTKGIKLHGNPSVSKFVAVFP